jgi:peptidyl-prolyl cis-trans isomerase B (cyclophilin B)
VTSTKDRQRAAARARLEREMAARAQSAHRRRQRGAIIGAAVAAVLVIGAVVWVVAATGGKKKSAPSAAASAKAATGCVWSPSPNPSASPAQPANPNLKNVGTPPASGEPRSGTRDMTINTNLGSIVVQLDLAKAPCTSASFTYLASKQFFDNTKCHRLTTSGIFVLQCGDPSGTGSGGPSYRFKDENLPSPPASASASPAGSPSAPAEPATASYRAGTLAMANAGADSNGSQFFIVYKDSPLPPNYTIFGTITRGLDVVTKVAAGGVAEGGQNPGDGKPKTEVTISSLTVAAPQAAPTGSESATTGASTAASASPSP